MVETMDSGTLRQIYDAGRVPECKDESPGLEMLHLVLNHVNYGLVVVNVDTGAVQFANVLGRAALEATADGRCHNPCDTGLCLMDGRVVARQSTHADLLRLTLARTKAGVRGLLNLGRGDQSCAVAVLPLSASRSGQDDDAGNRPAAAPACHALLMFARQQFCDESTMALFARNRGLTSAEGQVLAQVCRGLRPSEIADHHGVRISTVRTQLRSIRMKTSTETIRQLVQTVSVLPPMARNLSEQHASFA